MKGMLKSVAALALATGMFASSAHAQTAVQFGIGGGVGIPLSNFSDIAKLGFHGLANVEFQPASLPVGFRVEGMYSRFGFSDDFEALVGEGNWQLISGTANVVYTFTTAAESKFHPYLIGGAGAYNMKANQDNVDNDSETKFGINAGAGFNVAMGAAAVFIEGRFHNVFTEDESTNFVPISVGVRFGGK